MSKNIIRKFVLTLLPCFLIAAAYAATTPAVGEKAPDFTLKDLEACSVQLSDLTSKNDVVLVVLRGWPGYQCPLCNQQAHDFVKSAEKFKALGAHVVMVYPGPADELKTHAHNFLSDKSWPKDFDLVLDPDYSFTKAYGLRWEAPHETAYPSTFVIAKNGKITFSHISHQHGDRVKAETVLKMLPAAVGDSQTK
jgi:peroxiredoxin